MKQDAGTSDRAGASPQPTAVAIPFSRMVMPTEVLQAVLDTLRSGNLTGGGQKTAECHDILRGIYRSSTPLLTGSCTVAMEMAALVLGLKAGDEVIMPSWTFPSTANAVALRGAMPVFVDVLPDTLNIDPVRVRAAITPKTRAIFCVHYAGIACDMSALLNISRRHGLALIEDAAQSFGSTWNGRPLGGIGDFGALSFHGTKNVSSGEGGALIINNAEMVSAAEIAWEKGTDRLRFARGEAASYSWQGLGSSFLPSDLTAALLAAQLRQAAELNLARVEAWAFYRASLEHLAPAIRLPEVPDGTTHNGHIFAVRLRNPRIRGRVVAYMADQNIDVRPHYQPLHDSPGGRLHGRTAGEMDVTDDAGLSLLRLPIDSIISQAEQQRVVEMLGRAMSASA